MENNENKTPVTEEVKVENAAPAEESTTKVEEKKEQSAKKEKKSLFAKQKKPWEEDIPKEPLEKDVICYIGFVVLLIIAFVPYFIRILDSSYDDTKKFSLKPEENNPAANVPKSKKKLTCNKSGGVGEGYNYTVDVVSVYENAKPQTNDITYTIEVTDPKLTLDTVVIPEYKTISEVSSEGIVSAHEAGSNTYKITINYNADSSLIKNDALQGHYRDLGLQIEEYELNGFVCNTEKMGG